ncbi:MAG: hypothetical protein M5U14_13770 [Acidimicrobiia bacterium]|nr:hypothetical protein [Acidimicrobiia bacterium]
MDRRGYNWTVRRALKVDLRDVDSSVMLRRAVFDRIGPRDRRHHGLRIGAARLPAVRAGFRVAEVEIEHHPGSPGGPRASTSVTS